MKKQVIIKRLKCKPEISIDQPIVKKIAANNEESPVLLKIPLSELELIDENIKNVVSVPFSCY
jgi:hypothetical protein